jgi:hypothetical protein
MTIGRVVVRSTEIGINECDRIISHSTVAEQQGTFKSRCHFFFLVVAARGVADIKVNATFQVDHTTRGIVGAGKWQCTSHLQCKKEWNDCNKKLHFGVELGFLMMINEIQAPAEMLSKILDQVERSIKCTSLYVMKRTGIEALLWYKFYAFSG